jgi:hypothetical protein
MYKPDKGDAMNWKFTVKLPNTGDVAIKLLLFIPHTRPIEPKEAYTALADQFDLDSRQIGLTDILYQRE